MIREMGAKNVVVNGHLESMAADRVLRDRSSVRTRHLSGQNGTSQLKGEIIRSWQTREKIDR